MPIAPVLAAFCLAISLPRSACCADFEPPGPAERLAAIGSVVGLPKAQKQAFSPGRHFEPITKPGPSDWLTAHPERGQTYGRFLRSRANRPGKGRNVIYLLPIGAFSKERAPSLERLKEYAAGFFAMKIVVLPTAPLDQIRVTTRINPHTRKRQMLSTDVLELLKKRIPDDAFCLLAITMEDLYPEPSWNFVFGQASLRERVGVFSFVRYHPSFYGGDAGDGVTELVLKRSCKILAHETGHMFGIWHCVHFNCTMNGSNHLAESDSRPMHLCPVCLRKLHSSIRFDVVDRYKKLQTFYSGAGFTTEAKWVAGRLVAVVGEEE